MLPQLWASLFTLSTNFLEMNKLPLETIHPTVNNIAVSTLDISPQPIVNVVKQMVYSSTDSYLGSFKNLFQCLVQ
jgi:hypothetical protein